MMAARALSGDDRSSTTAAASIFSAAPEDTGSAPSFAPQVQVQQQVQPQVQVQTVSPQV